MAAFASRLPHDKMTFEETQLFLDIANGEIESYKTFLLIRNRIVSIHLKYVELLKFINQRVFIRCPSCTCGWIIQKCN